MEFESFKISDYTDQIRDYINSIRLKIEKDYDSYVEKIHTQLLENKFKILSEFDKQVTESFDLKIEKIDKLAIVPKIDIVPDVIEEMTSDPIVDNADDYVDLTESEQIETEIASIDYEKEFKNTEQYIDVEPEHEEIIKEPEIENPVVTDNFQFTLNSKEFKNAVYLFSKDKITGELNDLYLEAMDNKIRLTMNNVTVFLNAECTGLQHAFTLNYKVLSAITRALNSDDIVSFKCLNSSMFLINDKWKIFCKVTKKLNPVVNNHLLATIDVGKMKNALKAVSWCCPKNEPRDVLNALRVYQDICCVSNGMTLATINNDFCEFVTFDKNKGLSIPFNCIEIMKNSAFKDKTITVYADKLDADNYTISFQGEAITIKDNCYSNYCDFEPITSCFDNTEYIEVDKADLLHKIKLASFLAGEKTKYIRATLKFDKLVFKANNPNVGEAETWINLKNDYNASWNMGLNYSFLKAAIESVKDDRIVIKAVDHESPFVVMGNNGGSYKSLIMPMRLQ